MWASVRAWVRRHRWLMRLVYFVLLLMGFYVARITDSVLAGVPLLGVAAVLFSLTFNNQPRRTRQADASQRDTR